MGVTTSRRTGNARTADADPGPVAEAREPPPRVDAGIEANNARWSFAGAVPDHFEEHIGRSVPQYRQGHEMVAALSDFFLYDGAVAYELGCSTGALLRRLAEWNAAKQARIIGLEVEPAMVEAALAKCAAFPSVEVRLANVIEEELEAADLIVAYYTIQFIRPALRQQLLDKIYRSLNWGGAVIMFEKVRGPDARFQDIASILYSDFKLANGLSEAEIVHKTRSLKGVLEPFSTRGNLDALARAGFADVMVVFKHICFEGYLAIK